MNRDELEIWLLENPHVILYMVALAMGVLLCFILFIAGFRPGQPRDARSPGAWWIRPVDFGLFACALIAWFLIAGSAVAHFYHAIAGEDAAMPIHIQLTAGLLLQLGMLLIFWRFREFFRVSEEGNLSPQPLGWGRSAGLALFYFLATLPIIYGVSAVWSASIEILRRRFGWEIDLPVQDAIMLFRESDNFGLILAFIILAVVIAPIVEEIVFRGGVMRFLMGRFSLTTAIILSGFVFGLVHGNLQSLPGLVTVGIILGVVYQKTGNLKVPVFYHAYFNANTLIWLLLLPDSLLF